MPTNENQNPIPELPAEKTKAPVAEPVVFNSQASPQPTTPLPPAKSYKKVLISLIIVVILLTGGSIITFHQFRHHSKPSSAQPASSLSVQIKDSRTGDDLATIDKALENYVKCETDVNCGYQEPKSADNISLIVHGKLNNSISSYTYKNIYDTGGDQNTFIYQICAEFNTNTFSVPAFNNIWGSNDTNGVDGSQANSYAVHSRGSQCYLNDLSFMGQGLFVMLNSYENQFKNQLYNHNFAYFSGGSPYVNGNALGQ